MGINSHVGAESGRDFVILETMSFDGDEFDEFLRASISMLVKGVTAWRIGKFIPYPFKVIYARYKAKLRHLPAQPL